MIFALRILLGLLALVLSADASGKGTDPDEARMDIDNALETKVKSSAVPQIPTDSADTIAENLAELYFEGALSTLKPAIKKVDIEAIFEEGYMLRSETATDAIETVVQKLNEKLDKMAKQGYDDSSIAGLLNCFDHLDPEELLNAAIKIKAVYVLRSLQFLYIWRTEEQHHLFLAHIYEKEECYAEEIWNTPLVPMDWAKNWKAIFVADNPRLLKDIISGKILACISFALDEKKVFDLAIEYDSLEIFKSLGLADVEILKSRLGQLAELGSIKILQYFMETKELENLHFEDYPFPKRLPKTVSIFEFLMEQGYRYLSVREFLKKACVEGRVDILKYFYNIDPILKPEPDHLILAAKEGQLGVLKWAKDNGQQINSKVLVLNVVLSEQIEILEWLEGEYTNIVDQNMANNAAWTNQFAMVKWVHSKFALVPKSKWLGEASIGMLEWVRTVKPRRINTKLARVANASNLKWLWSNHRNIFTEEIRQTQITLMNDGRKMRWIFKNWGRLPCHIDWAASVGDLKSLKWAVEMTKLIPSDSTVLMAAINGHLEVLIWIYDNYPLLFNKDIVRLALEHGHVKIADYFVPILNIQREFIGGLLSTAYDKGHLELIQWAYKNYRYYPTCLYQEKAIEKNHLKIVKWMVQSGCIDMNSIPHLLDRALVYGSLKTYHFLTKKFGAAELSTTNIEMHWTRMRVKSVYNCGNLEFFKAAISRKVSIDYEILQVQPVSASSYHVRQWLKDNGHWTS